MRVKDTMKRFVEIVLMVPPVYDELTVKFPEKVTEPADGPMLACSTHALSADGGTMVNAPLNCAWCSGPLPQLMVKLPDDNVPSLKYVTTAPPLSVWLVPVSSAQFTCPSVPELSFRQKGDVPELTAVAPTVMSVDDAAATVGTPHEPSPRQKVVVPAPLPELRFVTGRFPVTPPLDELARLIAGKSAEQIARHIGTFGPPEQGAAQNVFWVGT